MATNYPTSLDDYTGQVGGASDALSSPSHPTLHTNIADAMEAVQAELGTTPSGASATVGARITAIEGDVTGKANDPHGNEAHSSTFATTTGNYAGLRAQATTQGDVGLSNLVNVRQTASRNGGQNIWVQSTAPTALATGDIWIETS
jgi:hypothetical protein